MFLPGVSLRARAGAGPAHTRGEQHKRPSVSGVSGQAALLSSECCSGVSCYLLMPLPDTHLPLLWAIICTLILHCRPRVRHPSSQSRAERLSPAGPVFILLPDTLHLSGTLDLVGPAWEEWSGATAPLVTALDSTSWPLGLQTATHVCFSSGWGFQPSKPRPRGGANWLTSNGVCECEVCVCEDFGRVCVPQNTHNPEL